MRRHGEIPRTTLLAGDALSAVAAACLAYWLRFHAGLVPREGGIVAQRYLEALPVAIAAMLGSCLLAGMYRRERLGSEASLADGLRLGALTTLGLATLALFYWKSYQYSRLALVLAGACFALLFPIGRAAAARILARLRRRGVGRVPAIVVGGGAPAAALAAALGKTPWMAVDVVGLLPLGPEPAAWPGAERLAGLGDVERLVASGKAEEVYVALPADLSRELGSLLAGLGHLTVDVRVVPDLGDALLVNPHAAVVAGLPVVSLRERPLYGLRAAAKRAVDVVLALSVLLLLSPLLLLIAVAVRVGSRGPVLYRQRRTGLDGREFWMLKFRTMQADAEAGSGPVFTRPDDPRTTALGRLLRRFSLDELPQLVNVLRGEMSLVGPRPERRPFIEDFGRRFPGYMLRHSVKAGMTGWAQVHGLRGRSSLEERLRYDLEYIDRWSLWLDLEILGRTALHVLRGQNAY